MKRVVLGLAVAAVAALQAAPASANPVEVQRCYATVIYPCGVCVTVGEVTECTRG